MNAFRKELKLLNYVIQNSQKVLLFAHNHPDGDTSGSVLSLKKYIESIGKTADVACVDPAPEFLQEINSEKFHHPSQLNLTSYDVVIACDSVERGFQNFQNEFSENQIIAILDHHPDISLQKDITIIDSRYSSVCEIVYNFFEINKININKEMATFLMIGILGDTGNFQHSNTTPRVIEIASILMKKGAALPKIINATFSNKKISTLKLWGRAFEKARINSKNGMIATVLTAQDIKDCDAGSEDIAYVASILNTVPGTKFSLVLSERENNTIKGSLRSEAYKGTDVSEIAHRFGGGGHKLASGFEIKGKIMETEDGWQII